MLPAEKAVEKIETVEGAATLIVVKGSKGEVRKESRGVRGMGSEGLRVEPKTLAPAVFAPKGRWESSPGRQPRKQFPPTKCSEPRRGGTASAVPPLRGSETAVVYRFATQGWHPGLLPTAPSRRRRSGQHFLDHLPVHIRPAGSRGRRSGR